MSATIKTADEREAYTDPLSDFQEGQWWVAELDAWATSGTDQQKRAVAVVHHMLRSASLAAERVPEPAALPAEVTDEQIDALDDLVTMVRRLVRALHKAAPAEPLTGLALDYLERKGFNKGPLRSAVDQSWPNTVEVHAAKCPALDGYPCVCGAAPIAAQPAAAEPDIKRAREILARLCEHGLVSMSVPVRQDDEDMVLSRVIAIAAAAPAQAAAVPAEVEKERLRGEIAYQLTKRMVIDIPTARAAVDAAFKEMK